MTQEELFAAIDETIRTNGQKQITAESLAALLKDIAANGGGGSGQGALKLYAFPLMSMDTESLSQMEAVIPGISAAVQPYINANAKLYATLKKKMENREEAPLVMGDFSTPINNFYSLMEEDGKEKFFTRICGVPLSLMGIHTNEGGEGLITEIVFFTNGNAALAYNEQPSSSYSDAYVLDENGGVTYVAS